MKQLKEPAKNLESNIQGAKLPDEYVLRAKVLSEEYDEAEKELERQRTNPIKGRDDSLCRKRMELMKKFREDIRKLRQEFNLD